MKVKQSVFLFSSFIDILLHMCYTEIAKQTEYMENGCIFIPVFGVQSFDEFDKMQIPYSDCMLMLIFCIWFVWRRLEFAFLCADFGRRTFLL